MSTDTNHPAADDGNSPHTDLTPALVADEVAGTLHGWLAGPWGTDVEGEQLRADWDSQIQSRATSGTVEVGVIEVNLVHLRYTAGRLFRITVQVEEITE